MVSLLMDDKNSLILWYSFVLQSRHLIFNANIIEWSLPLAHYAGFESLMKINSGRSQNKVTCPQADEMDDCGIHCVFGSW